MCPEPVIFYLGVMLQWVMLDRIISLRMVDVDKSMQTARSEVQIVPIPLLSTVIGVCLVASIITKQLAEVVVPVFMHVCRVSA